MKAQLKVYEYYFIADMLTDEIIAEFKEHLPNFYSFPGKSFLTDRITMAQLYIGAKITALERVETLKLLSNHFATSIYTASDTSAFPRLRNCGLAKTLIEMPLIFRESKININTTAKSIRNALPLRIWDIMGSGGFVLTSFQTEIPQLLAVGSNLDTYGSMEELLDKCSYYLFHEKSELKLPEPVMKPYADITHIPFV